MSNCFLRTGSDYLEDAVEYFTISSACAAFMRDARVLDRYGQKLEATIHIANTMEEVAEYPDYVLSLGSRGGLKKERT